jgi:hypothetical protein
MGTSKIRVKKLKISLKMVRQGARGFADLFPRVMKWCNKPRDKGGYYFFEASGSGPFLLGGIVIDIGPMAYGPFRCDNIIFIEDVYNPNDNPDIMSRLIKEVIRFAQAKRCRHIRGQIDYSDKIILQVMQNFGFAIVPIDDRKNKRRVTQYLVVKSLA